MAVRPDLSLRHEVRPRGRKCLDQFRGDDDVLGQHDIDAMRKRRADKIGVEQRDDAADACDAEPDRHVFRPVGHEQTDGVALAEAGRERPARITVRPFAERAKAQAFAVRQQRRCFAEGLREIVDQVRQDARRPIGNRLGRFEGT